MLVKSEAASRQVAADEAVRGATKCRGQPQSRRVLAMVGGGPTPSTGGLPPQAAQPKRFHGSVTLDATRVGRDSGRIADEVISHLAGPVGADVFVTLEIAADVNSGVPDKVVRTVTENCLTLKFKDHGV